jgi:hypothetical protein
MEESGLSLLLTIKQEQIDFLKENLKSGDSLRKRKLSVWCCMLEIEKEEIVFALRMQEEWTHLEPPPGLSQQAYSPLN